MRKLLPLSAFLVALALGLGADRASAEYRASGWDVQSRISAISTVPGGISLFMVGRVGQVWTAYRDRRIKAWWVGPSELSPADFAISYEVTALSTVPGGTSLFTTAGNGDVWSNYYDPRVSDKWHPDWFSLGGHEIFGPVGGKTRITAISTMLGGTSLYGVGKDDAVWSKYYDPRGSNPYWSDWHSLGGVVQKNTHVTALSTMENGTSLYVVGLDNAVWTRWFDPRSPNPQWSGWVSLGGQVRPGSDIAAISTTPGGTSLFIVGPNGDVQSNFFDPAFHPAKWSGWFSLGGVVRDKAGVTALSTEPRRSEVFVVGLDSAVWTIEYDPHAADPKWGSWKSLGGSVSKTMPDIAAASDGPNSPWLFVRQDDNHISTISHRPGDPNGTWWIFRRVDE